MAPPTQLEQEQAAQAGLAVLLEQDVRKLWPNIDVHNLGESLKQFVDLLLELLTNYSSASAQLAEDGYMSARLAAGHADAFRPPAIDPPTRAQVETSVGWATRKLWDTPAEAEEALNATEAESSKITRALLGQKALRNIQGAAEKIVLDSGRDKILETVKVDPVAVAWARIPEPGCCYFCALLATRGAVYKDDSFEAANATFIGNKEAPSDYKTHDHCRCHVEPVFSGQQYEPSQQIREWNELYKNTEKPYGSKAAQKAWRHAYDKAYPDTVSHPGDDAETDPGGQQ